MVTLELSAEELAIIARWRERYLSSDMPDTVSGAIHDMLRRIADDMREMDE